MLLLLLCYYFYHVVKLQYRRTHLSHTISRHVGFFTSFCESIHLQHGFPVQLGSFENAFVGKNKYEIAGCVFLGYFHNVPQLI